MANDLTGDFDVVAEFTTLAVNRVLAAMHRVERFPHSMSVRVDDNPPPGSQVVRPSVVGSVDTFGDATVNHNHIGTPGDSRGSQQAPGAGSTAVGTPDDRGHRCLRIERYSEAAGDCALLPGSEYPPVAEFVRGE